MAKESLYRYDLFVSYAQADRPWVEGYLLPALGLPVGRLITKRSLTPGAAVVSEFERAVTDSRYTLLVLSPAFLADEWSTFGEELVSYASVAEQRDRLIPLMIEPCELPLHIEFRVHLDCTDEAEWDSEITRLRALLDRPEPRPEDIPCPYPGLVAFGQGEAAYFFGRDQEIDALRDKLCHQDFFFVIGPSGSGKSSLVSAGLIPRLHKKQPGEWRVKFMRPGATPLAALQTALGDGVEPATFRHPAPEGPILLLVVDPFEEFFTLTPKADQPAFLDALGALHKSPGCKLLLVLRADFFPDLMNSPLWPVTPEQRLEIAPLRDAALRAAIAEPARTLGVYLQPSLVERLLNDAADEPGVLPLLQETLRRLWEDRKRRLIPLSAYERLGGEGRSGLTVALAAAADGALADLAPEQRLIAWRILLRLVQFGKGRADTRRQQPASSLRSVDDDPELFHKTLKHLADHRLLTLGGEAEDPDRQVDLAHEVLITGWPSLQARLAERRGAEQVRRRLAAKAAEWERLGRKHGGLLDAVELAEAEHWLASSDAAELGYGESLPALVEASQTAIDEAKRHKLALERRSRRRLWGVVAIVGMLLLVLPGLWVYRQALKNAARGALAAIPGGQVTLYLVDPKTEGGAPVTRTIEVASFQIERLEVSNRQFALCVRAGACTEPSDLTLFESAEQAHLPVVTVTAYQAQAYCRWLKRRLPTETEWQLAAQGIEARPWPWGTEPPDRERANVQFEPEDRTVVRPVHDLVAGATPLGVYGLAGNVMEWTASDYDAPERSWDGQPGSAPAQLTVRGSSWMMSPYQARPTSRLPASPDTAYRPDLGFRCALDAP